MLISRAGMMFSIKPALPGVCQALCARDILLDSLLLMGLWEKYQVGNLQLDVFVFFSKYS